MEKIIYPKYQEIASEITNQKSEMNKNSERLRSFLDKRGKEWHNEIDAMINEMKFEIYRTHSEIKTALNKQEEEMKHSITEMTKIIVELKRVLDSSDACLVSEYKSRNCEFKKLPRKLVFSFQLCSLIRLTCAKRLVPCQLPLLQHKNASIQLCPLVPIQTLPQADNY